MTDFLDDKKMLAALCDYRDSIDNYNATRAERREMDNESWRSAMGRVDTDRRSLHNAAARLAMSRGYIPRRPDLSADEELAAARNDVVSMLRALKQ